MTLKIEKIEGLPIAVSQFVDVLKSREERVYCFNGDMGVGKTTFVKEICKQLGTEDIVNSPTFSIINEYGLTDGRTVFHFDFYRIEKIEDALNIGVLDYFDSGNYCFVEWAENVQELIPENAVRIDIKELENGKRILKIMN